MSTGLTAKGHAFSRIKTAEPIAITGIGCRFPGGVENVETFWSLLCRGEDAVREVPRDRWDLDKFYHQDPDKPGKTYSRWGGFLDDIDRFDAQFFGISPREAAHVDPQQRLLLEVAWEALEDAGEVVDRLSGSDTGVFIGISSHDYSDIQVKDVPHGGSGAYASTGAALSIAANRLSYAFNFQGPSLAVDTACSSGLVAVHLACQSIWRGEVHLALAGGVNCLITPEATISFSKASMLSPSGRCKAFDASANGYVRSEGAGLVVLRPLSQAQADGARIYAVIRATALNQDGRTQGLTLPNRSAQEALLRRVYRQAGIDAREVTYIEAHGTGTAVGDPIEANAIGSVLGRHRTPENRLWIGSVKTNIGHLEAASGLAGLIKTALMLERRKIPANLHFETPNPRIDFDGLHLRVPTRLEPWPRTAQHAIAGVNSFGFGGTNAHIVLSEAPPVSADAVPHEPSTDRAHLLPLSARTPDALRAVAGQWLTLLDAPPCASLADLCYSASVRRSHHDHRLSLVFTSVHDLRDQLDGFLHDEGRPGMVSGRLVPGRRPKLAFVFSGMGPQWWAMGRRLMEQETVFRESIETCARLLGQHVRWSLLEELLRDEGSSRMHETEIAQPAIFALQVSLAALWRSWGIEPEAIVGHSAGEVAAAYVAGALDLEDAVKVIYHRSRLQQLASGKGRMLAIGGPLEEAQRRVAVFEPHVCVAAINSANSITLSGDSEPLRMIADAIARESGYARFLTVDVPYHSYHMEPLREDLIDALRGITPRPASIPIVSTVTGAHSDASSFDPEYWWGNVSRPVLFAQAVARLIADGFDTFVEIAPHPALARPLAENLMQANTKAIVVPSLRRDEDDLTVMLSALGNLHAQGGRVDWRKLYPEPRTPARLPSYPWQRETHWTEPEASRQFRLAGSTHPLLGRRLNTANATWEVVLDTSELTYLRDHQLQDSIVYPAAAYVEMALGVGQALFGDDPFSVERLELLKPIVLADDSRVTLQTVFDAEESMLRFHARRTDAGPPAWTLHATASLVRTGAAAARTVAADEMRRDGTSEIDRLDCYREFEARGLRYGPVFQGIHTLWSGPTRAIGLVHPPESLNGQAQAYSIHPAILDSCFQVLIGAVDASGSRDGGAYVPFRIGHVRLHRAVNGGALWSYAHLVTQKDDVVEADYSVVDEAGHLVVEITGFQCRVLATSRSIELEDLGSCLWDSQWFPKARAGALHAPADFLPSPATIAAAVERDVERLSEDMDRPRYYREILPALDRLCMGYICEALRRLGWAFLPGQHVSTDAVVSQLGIAPAFRRCLDRFLDITAEDGLLEKTDGGWQVRKPLPDGDLTALCGSFVEDYPQYGAEIGLLAGCGASLAEVLRGEQDPLQLLFPAGSVDAAERFYREASSHRFCDTILQRVVERAAASLPPDRAIRILEIGAGTGATSSCVLPVVPPNQTEYVFSDVSRTFTAAAKRKFADVPFIRYEMLDIERSPLEQGFEEHSFDLVVASAVLHATTSLRDTLSNVLRSLAPEGMLVLIEQTIPSRLIDLTFGLQTGWWRFTDLDLRPDHPWLPSTAWRALLADVGFATTAALSDGTENGRCEESIILARAPLRDTARRAEPDVAARESGIWLMLTDRGGVGEDLAWRLRSANQEVIFVHPGGGFHEIDAQHVQVDPARSSDMDALIEGIGRRGLPCRGIVHLWTLDGPQQDDLDIADLDRAETLGSIAGMRLVQALVREDWSEQPRLFFVTRGAQGMGPMDGVASLTAAPVWGFGRVLFSEHPQLRCTMIDLDPAGPSGETARLFHDLWSPDGENEVAFRGATRYVSRLTGVAPQALAASGSGWKAPAPETPFRLEVSRPGMLDSITLRETPRSVPDRDEVEIQVHTTGLNFRDVMRAMNLLPAGVESDELYGDECAGVIVRVGPGVEEFRPGDPVFALVHGSFASHVIAKVKEVFHKPAWLDFSEAATIPSAFLTASYALDSLAKLEPGERVLIHAAAGGVGLAAVQVARAAQARIFATAGSRKKRELLKSLGVEWVGDSRSLGFADELLRATDGVGVDVVLNSLAGEFILKSLSVLRPGGRFLEIGKVDIYGNRRLSLSPFRNALSFFAVDLVQVHRDRLDLLRALMLDVLRQMEGGDLEPLPLTAFPVSAVADAFRHMAQAKHVGKIVVSLHDDKAAVRSRRVPLFSADASYLMTGGLGGFGLAVAQWMVANGARHLVLAGRSGANADAERAVASMRRKGATVLVRKLDVTDGVQVESLVRELAESSHPLRGVLHAAMVLDDGSLLQMDAERFRRVTAPKIHGAWNLHLATAQCPLDFFVLFSSFSPIFGNPGQANYAAANTFLDALARYRRGRNLPALSVNWGWLADVGYVARHADISRYLEGLGLRALKAREATSILGHLLRADRPQIGAIRLDLETMAAKFPQICATPRWSYVAERTAPDVQQPSSRSGDWRNALLRAAAEERQTLVEAFVRERLARILGTSPAKLDLDLPLAHLGIDSLMAVELQIVFEELGVSFPMGLLGADVSAAQLVKRLLGHLAAEPAPEGREGIPARAVQATPVGVGVGV